MDTNLGVWSLGTTPRVTALAGKQLLRGTASTLRGNLWNQSFQAGASELLSCPTRARESLNLLKDWLLGHYCSIQVILLGRTSAFSEAGTALFVCTTARLVNYFIFSFCKQAFLVTLACGVAWQLDLRLVNHLFCRQALLAILVSDRRGRFLQRLCRGAGDAAPGPCPVLVYLDGKAQQDGAGGSWERQDLRVCTHTGIRSPLQDHTEHTALPCKNPAPMQGGEGQGGEGLLIHPPCGQRAAPCTRGWGRAAGWPLGSFCPLLGLGDGRRGPG